MTFLLPIAISKRHKERLLVILQDVLRKILLLRDYDLSP